MGQHARSSPARTDGVFKRLPCDAWLRTIKQQFVARQRGQKGENSDTAVSLVVPCYNVELYIDEFLFSVFSQTYVPPAMQVILVDDGSTDSTAAIIAEWKRYFPKVIDIISQTHAGQAVARNNGLRHVRHEWLTFPDADDFLNSEYFLTVLGAIAGKVTPDSSAFISCNIVIFKEDTFHYNPHPLSYKYDDPITIKHADDLGSYVQLSAASAWFRTSVIRDNNLAFDEKIKPSFEDSVFVNKYLILCGRDPALFLGEAIYYYRKRQDSTSTTDTMLVRKEAYVDIFKHGYLGLLLWVHGRIGRIPQSIQRVILYDLIWKLRRIVDRDDRIAFLSAGEETEFLRLLHETVSYIDQETIEKFDIARFNEKHKVAFLHLFKNAYPVEVQIFLDEYCKDNCSLKGHYFDRTADPRIELRVNGEKTSPLSEVATEHRIAGMTYVFRHEFSIRFETGDVLAVYRENRLGIVRQGPEIIGDSVSFEAMLRSTPQAQRPIV